jgi:hypothetical protein
MNSNLIQDFVRYYVKRRNNFHCTQATFHVNEHFLSNRKLHVAYPSSMHRRHCNITAPLGYRATLFETLFLAGYKQNNALVILG